MRLVEGEQPWVGRVELQINGVWGGFCGGVDWTASESKVVCRQLGYAGVLGEFTRYVRSYPCRVEDACMEGVHIMLYLSPARLLSC